MKRKLLFTLCFLCLPLTAMQTPARPVRELPAWMVNTYHYGVSPITTALVLLARAGWFTTRTAAQGAWNVGKFIVNEPAAACVVIPSNLFIAYYLYRIGKEQYRQGEREFNQRIEQLRDWLEEQQLAWENADIL